MVDDDLEKIKFLSFFYLHTLYHFRPSQPHRTAAQRRGLTENPQLMQAGDQLVKKEMDEFHHGRNSISDGSSNSSDQYGRPRTPLSPTTHTLILPTDDSDVPSQQLETFV